MSLHTLNLTENLYRYLQAKSLREPALLQELRKATAALPNGSMQSSPEQAQFMMLLLELMQARKALEIGAFTGYSTLAAALALPEDGQVIACDINKEWTALAQDFWRRAGAAHKIDLRIAPALETLNGLLNEGAQETFDFAFIDADKANYLNYYERCLLLIRQGGLIMVDNVLWQGKVADTHNQEAATVAIRSLNEFILQDQRVTMSLLPIGDGVTLVRKR